MTRLPLLLVSLTLFVLAIPAAALAKGASEATITGPGLGDAITLPGEGQPGGEQLMQLAEHAGFFALVFGSSPTPMQVARPEGALGPRYVIEYTMPNQDNGSDVIRQDLYPYAQLDDYAESAPVTYMEPGQRFFGTGSTVGGWWIANPSFTDDLVAAGLPETAPTPGGASDGMPWTLVAGVALAGSLAALGVLVVYSRRRSSLTTSSAAGG